MEVICLPKMVNNGRRAHGGKGVMNEMFVLYANKNQLMVREKEPVTSGSVKAYTARFEFSPDWDGLTRTAVFRAGAESQSVPLEDTNTCEVPSEVLVRPGVLLQVGVCGAKGEEEILPTVWADLGTVFKGVTAGNGTRPPAQEGEDKVIDHRTLSNRDAQEQHPIEAITGLQEQLERIPRPIEPITNKEMEDILK